MKIFQVQITEVSNKVVEIEAENIENAIQIITEKYNSEEIVLDSSDFVECKIDEYVTETNET